MYLKYKINFHSYKLDKISFSFILLKNKVKFWRQNNLNQFLKKKYKINNLKMKNKNQEFPEYFNGPK